MTARAAVEAAERLWVCATHDSRAPTDVAAAAGRLCTELRTELERWIGPDGFRALVERALVISRRDHAALSAFSWLGGGEAETTAAVAVQVHGPAKVAEGMVALLSALIELLGRIIGLEMAMQLVQQVELPSSQAIAKPGSEEDRNG